MGANYRELELRTSDPSPIRAGDMWVRTDLGVFRYGSAADVSKDLTPTLRQVENSVAIGTSATVVGDLTGVIDIAGRWRFKFSIAVVNVGTPTNLGALVGTTGAPGTSRIRYKVFRENAAATAAFKTDLMGAFNTVTPAALSAPVSVEVDGTFIATGAGVVNIALIRTGTTSATVQVGSYSEFQKVG